MTHIEKFACVSTFTKTAGPRPLVKGLIEAYVQAVSTPSESSYRSHNRMAKAKRRGQHVPYDVKNSIRTWGKVPKPFVAPAVEPAPVDPSFTAND